MGLHRVSRLTEEENKSGHSAHISQIMMMTIFCDSPFREICLAISLSNSGQGKFCRLAPLNVCNVLRISYMKVNTSLDYPKVPYEVKSVSIGHLFMTFTD